MRLVDYPVFSSLVVLIETETHGQYVGFFEGNEVLVNTNLDYPNNTKYSVYFLNTWVGLDELPTRQRLRHSQNTTTKFRNSLKMNKYKRASTDALF